MFKSLTWIGLKDVGKDKGVSQVKLNSRLVLRVRDAMRRVLQPTKYQPAHHILHVAPGRAISRREYQKVGTLSRSPLVETYQTCQTQDT